jgi:sterol desaturase/sphingolipid hydroxylase (fatty acid hydroxylase superfamily)
VTLDILKALAAAGLLLLLGDFVATFCYHVPEHVFGKFHSLVHHSPNRSFVRYALRTRQPLALVDGFFSAFPYLVFIPWLWRLSPVGVALGLSLAGSHVIWRHRFPPVITPQTGCKPCVATAASPPLSAIGSTTATPTVPLVTSLASMANPLKCG